MPVTAPRYRCTACGNLTRFDVTATRTTRAFHHYSVGGELQVEEELVLSESVDEISCRWCGNGRSVEEIRSDAAADAEGAVTDAADAEGAVTDAADAADRAGTAAHTPGR